MRQNSSIVLGKALLSKLRLIAAERTRSIRPMLSAEPERIVEQSDAFEAARRHALVDLDQGFDLGGRIASRDALHDREALR